MVSPAPDSAAIDASLTQLRPLPKGGGFCFETPAPASADRFVLERPKRPNSSVGNLRLVWQPMVVGDKMPFSVHAMRSYFSLWSARSYIDRYNDLTTHVLLAFAGLAAIEVFSPAAVAQTNYAPPYSALGKARAAGENPCYHVNEYGFGNYVRGPDGSFGCYPAGSDGAVELENEQRIKCRDYPSSC